MTDNSTPMPGTALKPCPFCGGPASRASKRPWLACCGDPDCLGYHYEQDEQPGYNHAFATEAEATAAWNTRTDTALLSALEKVREQLVQIAGRDFDCAPHQHGMAAAGHAQFALHDVEAAIASAKP